jgi:hypothetical protein
MFAEAVWVLSALTLALVSVWAILHPCIETGHIGGALIGIAALFCIACIGEQAPSPAIVGFAAFAAAGAVWYALKWHFYWSRRCTWWATMRCPRRSLGCPASTHPRRHPRWSTHEDLH